MAASYAGMPLRNPWGKASGQLSLNRAQIEEAADAGLGSRRAQDRDRPGCPAGTQSMAAWAIKESRMIVEPIRSPTTGAAGWTVTWKGRGWWQTFAEYLELVRSACAIGRERGLLVVPSVKYHLLASPARPGGAPRNTRSLPAQSCRPINPRVRRPMPLEKDFSPTLAGSDRASSRATVLDWLKPRPRPDP